MKMIDEKKIANAAMSEEELDQVAGGTIAETVVDNNLLYERGLVDDWHGTTSILFNWKSYSAKVDAGWAKAGITCVTKPSGDDNLYFMGGKEITHDEAIAHVKANFQKVRSID